MVAPATDDVRYFFIHVMKTAGFSLMRMILARVCTPEQVYPAREDGDRIGAVLEYARLRSITPERLARIKVFTGHFPYAARAHLGDVRMFTLLRHPVERTISHLKHTVQQVPAFKGMPLDQVYANEDLRKVFYDNLQLRYFAVRSTEGKSLFEPTPLGREHIGVALEQLSNVEVIGFTEEFEVFARMLVGTFGWNFRLIPRENQSTEAAVTEGLRERIAGDLKLELEFYEQAKKLYTERKQQFLARHGALPPINRGIRVG
jgi:hypothetical protein